MSRKALLRLLPGDGGGSASHLAEERYWDALVREQPLPSEAIDPTVMATIQRILALDDAPDPDPVFAARLEHDLRLAAQTAFDPAVSGSLGGNPASDREIASANAPTPMGRRVAMNIAATAALLAIVLASVVLTLWAGPLAPRHDVAAPLVFGPGITDARLLLQARFAEFPDGILSADIDRWVLQPGATMALGDQESGGEGPSAYLVESGTLTIQPDGLIAVTRAGSTTPIAVGEATELHPGDQGFAPFGITSYWQNHGTSPVRILEAKIRRGDVSAGGAGALNYSVISESPFAKPDHPIALSVFQVILQPGVDLRANTVPGLEMVKVESGRLIAVDVDNTGQLMPPVELGQATRVLGSFPPGRVFRSGNNEPVSLLVVIVATANPLEGG